MSQVCVINHKPFMKQYQFFTDNGGILTRSFPAGSAMYSTDMIGELKAKSQAFNADIKKGALQVGDFESDDPEIQAAAEFLNESATEYMGQNHNYETEEPETDQEPAKRKPGRPPKES